MHIQHNLRILPSHNLMNVIHIVHQCYHNFITHTFLAYNIHYHTHIMLQWMNLIINSDLNKAAGSNQWCTIKHYLIVQCHQTLITWQPIWWKIPRYAACMYVHSVECRINFNMTLVFLAVIMNHCTSKGRWQVIHIMCYMNIINIDLEYFQNLKCLQNSIISVI